MRLLRDIGHHWRRLRRWHIERWRRPHRHKWVTEDLPHGGTVTYCQHCLTVRK